MEGVQRSVGTTTLAALLGVGLASGVAAAQEGAEGGGVLDVSAWAAVAVLLLGTVVLMASVELLIHALVRTATRFGLSTFLLAVVFSGWEFDNVAFGALTGFQEMQDVAFGLAIGNAVSIFGLTLALGAILYPFEVDVPRDYLVMTIAAPALLVPVFVSGVLTPALSVMFLLMYTLIFAYVVQRERGPSRTFMQSDEVREIVTSADGQGQVTASRVPASVRGITRADWFWPLMLLVAIGGIVVGAEGSSAGVEGILSTWDLTGTFFGVTVITILYTVDDILLIVEPLRLGYEDIAVGGVVGSLLFFVTANVGVIGLVGAIHFSPTMVSFHLPVLFAFAALSSYFLWRGRLTRTHGLVLLGLYVLYLLLNVRFFAALPVGG